MVALIALGASVQVVRSAAVTHFAADRPEQAARFWPGHPRVQLALAMGEIGRSAASGGGPSPQSLARVREGAWRAPLAVEPFLVQGAVALSLGQAARAERLFVEAKRRDPRSAAARFFLAQQYLQTGRPAAGLAESAMLVRIVGGGTALVPGLAQYARTPGAVPHLRRLFAQNPSMGDEVLNFLAQDAANFGLVMALADDATGRQSAGPPPVWAKPLLGALVENGDFVRAHALWRKIAGVRQQAPGLFNPQFATMSAPAPFNWTLISGDFGVAEPVEPGGLQLLYYGRANADFATQLLLLSPGDYQLRMQVTRQSDTGEPSALAWTLECKPGGRELLRLPLAVSAGAATPLGKTFTIPSDCPAQWLKLSGTAREIGASEQAVVADLQLVAVGRR